MNENRSDASNAASATVPDTQNPTDAREPAGHGRHGPGRAELGRRERQHRRHRLPRVRGRRPGRQRGRSRDDVAHRHWTRRRSAQLHRARDRRRRQPVRPRATPRPRRCPTRRSRPRRANLNGTAGPGQVVLTWDASTDNVGVTGYRVYRNGTQVGSVLGAITTFTRHEPPVRQLRLHGARGGRHGQPLRREQHRDGERSRRPEADRALVAAGHRRNRPGRAELVRLNRQRRRHRLSDLPQRHARSEPWAPRSAPTRTRASSDR